ncbi:hypothetical protein CAter282_3759 [Collimonas arenae]|uniref:Uncharacterized protein n=1 Tax=Collimonas arenae TaxID=279058 RepID=A0A127PUS9_9BURK|nr:hypothetical protein CAter10_4107 [Collimonas arenae]AMP11437.1 hypothetical protein CAter282_3759 [Collimonas arenae]
MLALTYLDGVDLTVRDGLTDACCHEGSTQPVNHRSATVRF